MNKKFFGKTEPQCRYCEYGKLNKTGDCVVCKKAGGVMSPYSKCKKYRYDPLKREPKIVSFNKDFNDLDFSI